MKHAVVAAWLGATVLAGAQQPEPQTFRSGVDVVRVDVSVLDKHRVPVQGLTAVDFTLLEDGKPRPILAFAPVTLPPPRTTSCPRRRGCAMCRPTW